MTKCVWPVKPEERLCNYCKCVRCVDRMRMGSIRYGSVSATMREMKVGQKAKFDGSAWNAARTARWRMQKETGARFLIYTKADATIIERIA